MIMKEDANLPIRAFPVTRSAVAGLTLFDFRISLYPAIMIRYIGIPIVNRV